MTAHDLRCLIARYSVDPDNAEALELAKYYAGVLALMTEPEEAA